jgi:uncharacterized damage-inducible protein DinB
VPDAAKGATVSTAEETHHPPQDVHELLRRIEDGWRDLLEAIDGIPDDRMEEPGVAGEWSVKDLLGHIAFWEDRASGHIERALAGLPDEESDAVVEELNAADHAARHDRTLSEERAALHRAHAAVIEQLESVAGLDAAQLDEAVSWDTYRHYAEHVPDIRAWRGRVGV